METFDNFSTVTLKQNVIKSKARAIGSYHQKKVALTGFATKRYICSDIVHTLAHGHVEAQDKLHAANDVDWDDVNI